MSVYSDLFSHRSQAMGRANPSTGRQKPNASFIFIFFLTCSFFSFDFVLAKNMQQKHVIASKNRMTKNIWLLFWLMLYLLPVVVAALLVVVVVAVRNAQDF